MGKELFSLYYINLEKVDEKISFQKEKLDRIKIQRKAMQQYLLTGIVRVGK